MTARSLSWMLLGAFLVCAAPALAQEEVGHVASVEGTAEINRAGAVTAAVTGDPIQLGDELRTTEGQLRVVFRDDSVLNLGPDTRLVVDENVYQPEQGRFSSVVRLLGGKVRAAVGKVYRQPGASYEVETKTAVAGVRGTTFVVSFDDDSEVTEVVGIRGRVQVRSLDERLGDAVYVTAQEGTTVAPGQSPSRPTVLEPTLYRDRIEGLEIISLQGLGALASGVAIQSGGTVPPPDRAPLSTSSLTVTNDPRDTTDVVGQPLPVVEATRGRLGVPF